MQSALRTLQFALPMFFNNAKCIAQNALCIVSCLFLRVEFACIFGSGFTLTVAVFQVLRCIVLIVLALYLCI